jgi:hypothetical protein
MPRAHARKLGLNLQVFLLKERRKYVAYSPALDLSASGSSPEHARKNFGVTLRLFVEELLNHGTLERVLIDLGWTIREHRWRPPVEVESATRIPLRLAIPA